MYSVVFLAIVCTFAAGASAQQCSANDYGGLLTCLNNKISTEWSELEKKQKDKITADEKIITDCYKDNSCTATLKFDDFTDYLPDKVLKDMANVIVNFMDKLPRAMQRCILDDARDKLVGKLTTCIQKTQPNFALPSTLPSIPLPSDAMYKDHRDILKKYVTDRIIGALALKDCPKEKRVSTAKCMTNKAERTVQQCVKDNLCSKPPCKAAFTPTCTALHDCVDSMLKDAKTKISTLQDDAKTEVLSFLDKCQSKVQLTDPSYTYPHGDVLRLAKLAGQVKEKNLDPELKNTIKSLAQAYFSTESLCYNKC